jgi:hypothetical protein
MDKLQWFKFRPSDWMMGKIQRCPEITQARFLRLCCLYWNKECVLSIEDAEIEIDEEHLITLFKKKIVGKDDNFIHINFLDEQFKEREDNSSERSKAGSIGNLKRWHKDLYAKFESKELSLNEALKQSKLSLPDSDPITALSQNIAEKRRGEKRREDNNISNEPEGSKKTSQSKKPKKETKDLPARKLEFKEKCDPYLEQYGSEMMNQFFLFWTEHGENDTKMHFEKQKTFGIGQRLARWKTNNFGNNNKNNQEKTTKLSYKIRK